MCEEKIERLTEVSWGNFSLELLKKFPMLTDKVHQQRKNELDVKFVFLKDTRLSSVDYVPVKGEIIWYLSLTIWLISLSIMLSSSILAVAMDISSFFLSAA